MRFILFIFILLALAPGRSRSAERPELSRIFPAGGQLGSTVDVEATGKFPVWPVQIWSSTSEIEWNCQSDSGKLQAKISGNAVPGLHWMRVYAADGATVVRPFLVGSAPERNELEPNDRVVEANEITALPHSIQGILNKRGDVDSYSVAIKKNDLLVASIDSNKWLQSPADCNLQILDKKGFVLAENLDHVGLDPHLEFRAPQDGRYIVRVFGFPAAPDSSIGFSGGNDWNYRLRLGTVPTAFETTWDYSLQPDLADPSIEISLGQHIVYDDPLVLTLPSKVRGIIQDEKQMHFLRFAASASKHYRIRVLAREFGSELDAMISLFDAQHKELISQDDFEDRRDPILKWKAPTDGDVTLSVSDFHRRGGPDYRFTAIIEERPADFSINIANDLVSASIANAPELVVNVVRESDFAGAIRITAEGLPASVSCSVEESKHGVDSANKVTLKLQGTEAYQGPLQIVARSVELVDHLRTATAPSSKPIWLSISKE